ncbi:hypothetical protein IWX49DRAFT_318324 [Phyllosticta citricarpa]|uniref:Uncharacterized protein n=2 Tax=Phyllosticta TaxID=121621 RepID=A0ABR1LHS9_9PEZI
MANKRPRSAEPKTALSAKRTTHRDTLPAQACIGKLGNAPNAADPVCSGPASSRPVASVTLGEAISVLSAHQVREKLSSYALQNRAFRDFLWKNYATEKARRSGGILDVTFNKCIQRIAAKMVATKALETSRQYDVAKDVSSFIKTLIKKLVLAIKSKPSTFGCRMNAIANLGKLGALIATCGDAIGREIRKDFQMRSNVYTEAFQEVAKIFGDAEKPRVLGAVGKNGGPTFEQRLVGLINKCKEHNIMPDLMKSLVILRGKAPREVDGGNEGIWIRRT